MIGNLHEFLQDSIPSQPLPHARNLLKRKGIQILLQVFGDEHHHGTLRALCPNTLKRLRARADRQFGELFMSSNRLSLWIEAYP